MKLPQMIRNLWIYRKVVVLAVVVGVLSAFVFSNNEKVTVKIPMGPRIEDVGTGLVMLICTAIGSAATWVVMKLRYSVRNAKQIGDGPEDESSSAVPPESEP